MCILVFIVFSFRILAARLHIEGNETTVSTAFSISGKLTVAKMEILECLNTGKTETMEYGTLLSFMSDSSSKTDSPVTANPNLKLVFKHVEKTSKRGLLRRSSIPKTDIT